MKTLVIIDTHALIHRAWHALPQFTDPNGRPVGAVYGFAAVLLKMLRELKPDYLVAAFDLALPTFREKTFAAYKATRAETPSELSRQFPVVRDLLQSIGIPVLEAPGFEADDVIGTIVEQAARKRKLRIIILTGDLDALQLVRGDQVLVYTLKRGVTDTVLYDEAAVKARYDGLAPSQLPDLKGLKGDPSDNIPGVKGVGEKTAIALLKVFGTLERIWRALEHGRTATKKHTGVLTPKLIERLREERKNAFLSRMLATIRRDAPITFSLENAHYQPEHLARARRLFEDLGFQTLLKRLPQSTTLEDTARREPSGLAPFEPSIANFELQKLQHAASLSLLVSPPDIFIAHTKDHVFRLPQVEASRLSGFFENEKLRIIGFDIKPLLKLTRASRIHTSLVDLSIAWWLLHPHLANPELRSILEQELGTAARNAPPSSLPALFLELAPRIETRLEVLGLLPLFREIEMPLVPVLAAMEERGILVDRAHLKALKRRIRHAVEKVEHEIWDTAGERFRISSPVELRTLLFEKLKLQQEARVRKTPGGILSTQDRELSKLARLHPIVALIRSWRELSKLESTYLVALASFINPATSRVHPTFVQTGTVTGRLSCVNPNLQNIPAREPWGHEIRNLFVAPKGFSLISFDYSQLELRIAAHLSQDEALRNIFAEGRDVHRETATAVFGVRPQDVDATLRDRAKTLNFGMLYGMGPASFAESAGMSRDDARRFIDAYFEKFSRLKIYFDELLSRVNREGFLETIFGRKRFFPVARGGWAERGRIERMAVNFPIQGSEADIMKRVMIRIEKMLMERGWEEQARMLLQIHDELLFEIRDAKMKEIIPAIRSVCEAVHQLTVPLEIDVAAGKRWGSLERL